MAPHEQPVEETVHYDNGKIKYTGFLLGGEMHGPWSWYRRDGSLMRYGSLERGRQVGTWRTFDRTGNVVKESALGDPLPPSDGRAEGDKAGG